MKLTVPTNGQSFKLARWSLGKSAATARRISVVVAAVVGIEAAAIVEVVAARVLPPFMKARKVSVLSGAAMAWSVSSFLRMLVLDRGRSGVEAWLWEVDCVDVGAGGYDGNQTSRRSCQRKFGGVESRV